MADGHTGKLQGPHSLTLSELREKEDVRGGGEELRREGEGQRVVDRGSNVLKK